MMQLWLYKCDRRGFVDFITNRKPLEKRQMQSTGTLENCYLRDDKILLAWKKPPTESFSLPSAVVVAEDSTVDFLAWVSTYFRHIRPFTAHCRVLGLPLALLLTQSPPAPARRDIGSADIGLILTEGITYSAGRTNVDRLPFSVFTRTLSFAYAEAVKRYEQMFTETDSVFDFISDGWHSARELSNQPSLDLPAPDIGNVWALVLSAASGVLPTQDKAVSEPLVVDALQGVRTDGRIPRETWTGLVSPFPHIESLIEIMEGPREGRVKAAELAIRTLAHGPEAMRVRRAFTAGYIVSRIQPGSLAHFSLLFPLIHNLRESFLWYGACSGLTPETAVDDYGNGLGWLMKRELGRASCWLDRPTCDISLSEMEVLLRSREGSKFSLPTLANGVLNVEIFPLISTSVKWHEYGEERISERGTLAGRQPTLFGKDARSRRYLSEILREIEQSSISLDAIRKQVEALAGERIPKGQRHRKSRG